MLIDPAELSVPDTYFTLTQTVMPRPIAWVLSENEDGSHNLAPFSYFNAVCSDPPLVMFSVGLQPDGTRKDTLVNISARPNFVIHIASCSQLPELNKSSATLPYGESEIDAADIALVTQEGFELPRIRDCRIAFMCDLYLDQEIGNTEQHLLFGQIRQIYIDDDAAEITDQGRLKVNAEKVEPLARLGASEYADFGNILRLRRPD